MCVCEDYGYDPFNFLLPCTHTHILTHSLSLSLSLTHTHTHTHSLVIYSNRKAIGKGDGKIVFEVTFSMMEIYNEAVQDLLGMHVKGGMKVRESPKKGFYVDGLSVIPVQSFKEIEDHMEKVRTS